MEKQLIEQLISNGLSIKKIKNIVEKLDDDEPHHDFNKTTIANTCGLRLIKCGSCNKQFYEDKFMLNRLNKRYRSCIDCVMRQRAYRQKDNIINIDNSVKNESEDNAKILAILDKEYDNIDDEDKTSSEDVNDNTTSTIYPIEKHDNTTVALARPSNDKPKQIKPKKKINHNHMFSLLTPEQKTEPEEPGLRFFDLFNSK